MPGLTRFRSKSWATWAAVLGGTLGAHRFYLHGRSDLLAWLHPWPTLLGLVGVLRLRELGQDDRLAWLLIPLLGLMIAQAMLAAIVIALTPDETWQQRFNPGQPFRATGWVPVIGAIAALLLGGAALMSALAFGGQKFFEYQAEPRAAATPQAPFRTA